MEKFRCLMEQRKKKQKLSMLYKKKTNTNGHEL